MTRQGFRQTFAFFLVSTLFINCLNAQINQICRVIDVKTKQPVENAIVKLVGCNDAITDVNGYCKLIYSTKTYGDPLIVKDVIKEGMDYYSTGRTYTGNAILISKDTIELLLINKKIYSDLENKLFDVALGEYYKYYEKYSNDNIDSLNKYPNSYKECKDIFDDNIYFSFRNLSSIVNSILAEAFPSENSLSEKMLNEVFLGNINKAYKALENENLIDKLNQKQISNDKRNEYLDALYLYTIICDLQPLYKKNIDLKPYYKFLIDNKYRGTNTYQDYLYYLLDKGEYKEVDNICKSFEKSDLHYYDKLKLDQIYALSLSYQKGKSEKAIKRYEDLIAKLVEVNNKEDNLYLSKLSNTYYNFGYFYGRNNDFVNSEKYFQKSIEAFRGYYYNDKSDKNRIIANLMIYQLSNLYANKKDKEANNTYKEAQELIEQAYELNNSKKYEIDYIVITKDYMLADENNFDIDKLNRIAKIEESYAKEYPMWFVKEVLKTKLNLIQNWFQSNKDYSKVIKDLDEAKEIMDNLNDIIPNIYAGNYIVIEKYKKYIAEQTSDSALLVNSYKNIINISAKYAHFDSINYIYDLADNAYSYAEFLKNYKDHSGAEKYYLMAYDGTKKLIKYDRKYIPIVGIISYKLADERMELDKDELSIQGYKEAIEINDKLNKEEKEDYLKELAYSTFSLGYNYKHIKKYKEAIEEYNDAIKDYKKLTIKDSSFMSQRGNIYHELGLAYYSIDKKEESRDAFIKSIENYSTVIKRKKTNQKYLNSITYLSDIYKELGDYKNYEKTYCFAVDVAKRFATIDPENYLRTYASLSFSLGKIHYEQERYKDSENDYNTSLGLYKKMKGDDIKITAALVETLYLLGQSQIDLGSYNDAINNLEEALAYTTNELMPSDTASYFGYKEDICSKLALAYYFKGGQDEDVFSLQKAKSNWNESLEIKKLINYVDDGSKNNSIAYTLFCLGDVNGKLKQFSQAEKCFKESKIYRLKGYKKNKEDVEVELVKCIILLGDLYNDDLMDTLSAQKQYQEAMSYYNDMSKSNKEKALTYYLDAIEGLLNTAKKNDVTSQIIDEKELNKLKEKVYKQIKKQK